MIPVVKFPSSGVPEESSKIEPTPAIAAMQQPNNNTPLFGVTLIAPLTEIASDPQIAPRAKSKSQNGMAH